MLSLLTTAFLMAPLASLPQEPVTVQSDQCVQVRAQIAQDSDCGQGVCPHPLPAQVVSVQQAAPFRVFVVKNGRATDVCAGKSGCSDLVSKQQESSCDALVTAVAKKESCSNTALTTVSKQEPGCCDEVANAVSKQKASCDASVLVVSKQEPGCCDEVANTVSKQKASCDAAARTVSKQEPGCDKEASCDAVATLVQVTKDQETCSASKTSALAKAGCIDSALAGISAQMVSVSKPKSECCDEAITIVSKQKPGCDQDASCDAGILAVQVTLDGAECSSTESCAFAEAGCIDSALAGISARMVGPSVVRLVDVTAGLECTDQEPAGCEEAVNIVSKQEPGCCDGEPCVDCAAHEVAYQVATFGTDLAAEECCEALKLVDVAVDLVPGEVTLITDVAIECEGIVEEAILPSAEYVILSDVGGEIVEISDLVGSVTTTSGGHFYSGLVQAGDAHNLSATQERLDEIEQRLDRIEQLLIALSAKL